MLNPFAKSRRHPTRRITPGLLVALLVGLAGCNDEPIQSYTVPKQPRDPVAALPPGHPDIATPAPGTSPGTSPGTAPGATPAASTDGGVRMLGAIIPAGDRTWYVKLVGPAADVDHHAGEFESFVRSTAIPGPGDDPIGWSAVPEGWERKAGGGAMRFVTFSIAHHEPALEVTVIPLGRGSGTVKANVDRWRGQIGLADATPDEMAATTKQLRIAGVDATLVDITGPGSGTPGAAAPIGPHVPPLGNVPPIPQKPTPASEPAPAATNAADDAADDADAPIRVTLPEGWSKLPDAPAMAVVGYVVERDGQKLVTSVSRFAGDAGGVQANIARWAGQVGAAPGDAKPKAIKVDGSDAVYVDLAGPEGAANRRRTLGVIIPRGDATWFIKMSGPADPVAAERERFEALVGSIRFNAAAPGKGE